MRNIKLDYELFPKQIDFFLTEEKFTLLASGVGYGKTTVGAYWSLVKAFQNPQCLGFIGANIYKQLELATLRKFFELCDLFKIKYHKGKNIITLENKIDISYWSLEKENNLRGPTIGWAWLDESRDTDFETVQVVMERLRDPKSDNLQMKFTSSLSGFNWLYTEFQEKQRKGYKIIVAKTKDNPTLPQEYIDSLYESFDPLLARQELEAEFLNINKGRVYYAFSRDKNCKDVEYNKDLPLCLSFDFNITPMTATVVQIHKNEIYVIDEIVIETSNTGEVCREFMRRYGEYVKNELGFRCQIYGDATGRTRGATTGKTDYDIVKELIPSSLNIPESNPPVIDRINTVNAKLENAKGEVSMFINPRCKNLILDLEQVSYKSNTREIDKSNPKLTHSSDNIGYLVYENFGRAKPGIKFI